jgi:ASC-1-like (ASCH) protein
MTIHSMKLNPAPFNAVLHGEKTVECRLYDEKRQKITLGDSIAFSLISDETQCVVVRVIGLLRYETFESMFMHNEPRKFGGQNRQSLTDKLLSYYSRQEQEAYGVLGIEFKLE